MTDAVAIPNQGMAKYATDDAFNQLAKAADFLPRFALYGSNSNACKKGQIGIGMYGYTVGDAIKSCGPEVRCFSLGMRLKAMRISGDKVEAFFNPNHDEFKKIKAESSIKDTGALAGPEFFLWLPEHGVFVTFFMANKSMRREAPKVYDNTPHPGNPDAGIPPRKAQAMTLKATLVEKGTYMWHAPVMAGCSLDLAQPDPEQLAEELAKFNNPPEPKDEAAGAADKAATNRAR